jgi:hypothetical protein
MPKLLRALQKLLTGEPRADRDTEEDCDLEIPQPQTWMCTVDRLLEHLERLASTRRLMKP